MTELLWRSASLPDAPSVAALFGEIERLAPIGLETELAEVQARLSWPQLDLDTGTLAGFDAVGRLLAYAEAADMGIGQGQVRIRVTGAVHPELGPDVVASTLDWLLARARDLIRARGADLPGVLGARCAATDQARLRLLTEAGFEVVRWHQDLVRSVSPAFPCSAPAGMSVVSWDPRYQEAARIAHNEAYADDPAALLPDAQSWPQHATGLANFRPDASYVAMPYGHDVVGFLFSLENHDSTEGLLYCLGVTKPWRRRGLATSLIGHALAAFDVGGFTTLRLEVNSDNTSALRLYHKLGFTGSDRGYAMLQAKVPCP
jgi:mycothiol synthase